MTREIPLTQGKVALVDDEDFARLMKHFWCYSQGRAVRNARTETRAKVLLMMHREIIGAPQGRVVDHINGNALDNRRANLRVCSQGQNTANCRKPANNTSGFKGVTARRQKGTIRWIAQIAPHRRGVYLGMFDDKLDAARAYDAAARKYFGEFARVNFPGVS